MSITIGGVTYTDTTIIGGVECAELVEGMVEGVHDDGPEATKRYLCEWAKRYTLANAFLGLSSGTGGAGGSVFINRPLPFPESPNMTAREISIKGVGKPSQGTRQLQFPYALVDVNFGVPSWGGLDYPNPNMSIDPTEPFIYATQDVEFGVEILAVEGSACKLANGHPLPGMPYTMRLATTVLNITLMKVPFLDFQAIKAATEKPINSTKFLGADPGFLRFDGARNRRTYLSDGTGVQDMSYVFAHRPVLRWDEVFDPDGVSGPVQVVGRHDNLALVKRSELRNIIPTFYLPGV